MPCGGSSPQIRLQCNLYSRATLPSAPDISRQALPSRIPPQFSNNFRHDICRQPRQHHPRHPHRRPVRRTRDPCCQRDRQQAGRDTEPIGVRVQDIGQIIDCLLRLIGQDPDITSASDGAPRFQSIMLASLRKAWSGR